MKIKVRENAKEASVLFSILYIVFQRPLKIARIWHKFLLAVNKDRRSIKPEKNKHFDNVEHFQTKQSKVCEHIGQ